jgi:hypothetical protein
LCLGQVVSLPLGDEGRDEALAPSPAQSTEAAYHLAYHRSSSAETWTPASQRVKGQQDLNGGGHENCTAAVTRTERWRPRNLHA